MKNQKLKLVLPSKKYLKSYQNFCRDFIKNSHSEKYRKEYIEKLELSKDPFFLKKIRNDHLGINLEKGKGLQARYWALSNDCVVGKLNLRNTLGKKFYGYPGNIGYAVGPKFQGRGYATEILRLGLLKARKLGLKKILLTCDVDNLVSRKVIEKNGGKLKKEAFHEQKKALICFYWIML